MRRKLSLIGLGVVMAVGVLVPAQPAQGGHLVDDIFGSAAQAIVEGQVTQISLGNNSTHRVELYDLTNAHVNAMSDMTAYYGFVTDLTTQITSPPTVPDVRVSDGAFGDVDLTGWVNCPVGATESGSNPTRTCFTQTLTLNTSFSGILDADEKLSLACHELGHTLGMRHNPGHDTCMRPGSDERRFLLRAQDGDVIDFFY